MLQLRKQRNQKGFTLVEIAIVLVIVGLVLFAVMKGGDMVKSGKAKKTIDQMDQLRASVLSYSNQHGGKLPESTTDALQVLADAKSISYNATAKMYNGFGGEVTATTASPAVEVTFVSKGIPDYVARQMDMSLDDGVGTTGEIQFSTGAYTSTDAAPVETTGDVTMKVK